MTSLSKHFPDFGLKNIRLFYLLGIFLNGWFFLSNWTFYFLKYVTKTELGIIEGLPMLIGIILEIPTGALADLLGKKRIIIIGSIIQIIACLTIINSHSFLSFLIGNILVFIGVAFQSGSIEAFAYDSLKEKNLNEHYDTVITKYTTIGIITTIISTGIGGFLYSIKPWLPFLGWAIFLFFSVIVLWQTTEPAIDTYKFNFKNYCRQFKEGIAGLFGKQLRIYLFPILSLAIIIHLYQGIMRQSMATVFLFNGETFGYLLSLVLIPGAIVSFNFDKIKQKFSEKTILASTLTIYIFAFLLAIFARNILLGGLVFLIIMVIERIAEPLISILINHKIDSKHRATILSTEALIGRIPYIILVLFFVQFTTPTKINYLFVLYSIIMFITLIYSLIFIKSKIENKNK